MEEVISSESDTEEREVEEVAEAVARYRELVASAPDVVPELVQGSTVEEVDRSAAEARRVFDEISRRVVARQLEGVQAPTGNPARSGSDAYAETLRPEAKIAFALRRIE